MIEKLDIIGCWWKGKAEFAVAKKTKFLKQQEAKGFWISFEIETIFLKFPLIISHIFSLLTKFKF